ncbi:MAG: hypothetical protein JWN46_1493 [Acidimicrobiales bacterium]|nr:hypothetical protein [Acidimicrobiales bacterium]
MYTRSYPTGSRAEQAYGDLKGRLLAGEFALNVRLGEERLAAIVGASRTPVREALARLHVEGLVARAPDGGYLPAMPDVEVMRNLYEVRAALELRAISLPSRHGGTHDLAALESLRADWLLLADEDPSRGPEFVLLDESFHIALADAAGNPPLVDFLRQVNERIRVVRMQDFLSSERITSTVVEHLGLVEALLAGDVAGAEVRFTNHLESSMAVVEERVARAIASMVSGGRR